MLLAVVGCALLDASGAAGIKAGVRGGRAAASRGRKPRRNRSCLLLHGVFGAEAAAELVAGALAHAVHEARALAAVVALAAAAGGLAAALALAGVHAVAIAERIAAGRAGIGVHRQRRQGKQ